MNPNQTLRKKKVSANPLWIVLRLIFLGIGLGAITGSAIKTIALYELNHDIIIPNWISFIKKENNLVKNQNFYTKFSNQNTRINKLSSQWDFLSKNEKRPEKLESIYFRLFKREVYGGNFRKG